VALDELLVEKLKSGLVYALESKTINIINKIMVINMSNNTRSAEDDNLLMVWRDTESKTSSIFLIPLLRGCLFLFNSS